jgi:hypothetical protein
MAGEKGKLLPNNPPRSGTVERRLISFLLLNMKILLGFKDNRKKTGTGEA